MRNIRRFISGFFMFYCLILLTACGKDIPFPEISLTEEELENKFYYNLIETDEARQTYKELYEGLKGRLNQIYVHNNDELSVGEVINFITYDYPEFFWCDAETEVTYQSVNEWGHEYTIISPDYAYSLEEVSTMKKEIESKTQKCIEACKKKKSDYKKVKYVYEYIVDSVEYKDSPNDQNIYSALVSKKSVCAGYAKSVQYLLERAGIECYTVSGEAKGEDGKFEGHAWNVVNCDGKYYYVDATWADPEGQEENEQNLMIYDYLCCDEEQLADTHKGEYKEELPECTSDDLNYYRRNGMFYETYEYDEIYAAMKESIADKKMHTTFKFADVKEYEKALKEIEEDILDDALQYQVNYYGMSQSSCTYDYDEVLCKINIYWSYD